MDPQTPLTGPATPLEPAPNFVRLDGPDLRDPDVLPEGAEDVESSAAQRLRRAGPFARLTLGVVALVLGASLAFLFLAQGRDANGHVWNQLSEDAGTLVARASLDAAAAGGIDAIVADPARLRTIAAEVREPVALADGTVLDDGQPIDVRALLVLTSDDAGLRPLPAYEPWASLLPPAEKLPEVSDIAPTRDADGNATSLPVTVAEHDDLITAFVSFNYADDSPLHLALQRDAVPGPSPVVVLLLFALGLGGAALLLLPAITKREALLEQQESAVAGLVRSKADALRSVNQLDRVKSDFLTAVSHRFRQPLQVVQGVAKLLTTQGASITPEMQASLAERLDKNAKRLDELLQDLLDVDRLTRGGMEPTRRRVDVVEEVQRVVDGLDISDRVQLPDGPVPGLVDASHLERMLEHLLRNAVQHSPDGATIDVTAERAEGAFELAVHDRGPGIAQEHRLRVFDPLYRIEEGSPNPGVGIGLSLVQRLAGAHGGRAWAEPREGGGSSFFLRIPDEGADTGIDLWQVSGNLSA